MGRQTVRPFVRSGGESGRHLLLGSLRSPPVLGRLLRRGVPPRPRPCVSDSAAVVCVYCQVRSSYPWGVGGGEGLAMGTEEQGKAGPAAAPGASVASAVRAPSFLAKHRLSRQPPCGVVCALPSFLKSEDLEGFHRYFFFLCYVIVVSGGRKALKARLVRRESGQSV